MRCPTLSELPSPPWGKNGWPFDGTQDKPWRMDDGRTTTKRVSEKSIHGLEA